eukprot:scaffold46319_cov32-Prasinocladus_malaysianus.AAC.1
MANDGACDYVHWEQHAEGRNYLMESGVLCGWNRIRELQLAYCDCTRVAGKDDDCEMEECTAMALEGV